MERNLLDEAQFVGYQGTDILEAVVELADAGYDDDAFASDDSDDTVSLIDRYIIRHDGESAIIQTFADADKASIHFSEMLRANH